MTQINKLINTLFVIQEALFIGGKTTTRRIAVTANNFEGRGVLEDIASAATSELDGVM